MCEKTEAFIHGLNALSGYQRIALRGKFRDGIGDAIVEAAVESSNSSTSIGASRSNARSVIAWQRSP